jgi:translation initiation factor IF-2
MSSKVRVYEVAKQLGVEQKALVSIIQQMGLTDVKNHMSVIDPDVVDRVRRHLEKQKQPVVVEERIRPNVIRRRPAQQPQDEAPAEASAAPPSAAPSGAVPPVRRVPAAPPSGRVSETSEHRVPAPRASSPKPLEAAPPARESVSKEPVKAAEKPESAPEIVAVVAKDATENKVTPAAPSAEKPAAEAPKAAEIKASDKAPEKAAEKPAEPTVAAASDKPTPAVSPGAAETSQPAAAASAKASEPAKAEPAKTEPAKTEPVKAEPAKTEPAKTEPAKAAEASAPAKAAPGREPEKVSAQVKSDKVEHSNKPQEHAPRAPEPAPRSSLPSSSPRPAPPVTTMNPQSGQSAGPARPSVPPPSVGSSVPKPKKTGIEVWGGRPGVTMPPPPDPRSPPSARRQTFDINKSGPARPGMGPARPGMSQGGPSRPGMGGGRPGMRPPYGRPQGPQNKLAPKGINTAARGADKKIIKIEERVNLPTLAARMGLKATDVLMKLIQMGMPGVNINSSLDADTAKIVASEFGWDVEDVAVSEEEQLIVARGEVDGEATEPRSPIVTVMGHVDHGKTSLLDQIRKTNVAVGEAGGITQHIGAYRVTTSRGPITFLDTPGHEAFTAMRARGANLTDIVVLVVAADDGMMPQTREAVAHAKQAKVPIIVAINKIDKPEANPERVRRQLMELELVPEELGGTTIYCEVSAKTRAGVDHLLEMIALQAEVMELRSNPKRPAHAVVVEALLDRGKGPVARVIVLDGVLKTGDFVLSGPAVGKVRAMTDDMGRMVTSAGPSMPVEIQGLSDVPNAGEVLDVVKDPKKAQEIAEQRADKLRKKTVSSQRKPGMTFDDFALKAAQGEQVELRIVIKADVRGSVEALTEALNRLSGEKVKLTIVDASVGAINESDVNLAIASKAIIVGFNARPAGKASSLAESEGIQIKQYNIIYNVIDDIRRSMEGLLAPIYVERALGKAEVRMVLKLSKSGIVAGSMVTEGVIKRNSKVRIRRGNDVVFEGKLAGLKRFKEDVKEVPEGFECGISIDGFEAIKEGDMLEVFELEEVRQKL